MTSQNKTKQVLVVGGGTSGWISACYLAKHLGSKHRGAVQVTLIESEDIGIIGVGEGTFPTIRTTLKKLGISETEFMRETTASFKQAIKFVDWQHNPIQAEDNNQRNYYYHLFDVPKGAPYFDISPYWLQQSANKTIPFDEFVSAQAANCEMNLSPKKITTKQFEGMNYAYHLDAVKFGQFLRKHGTSTLGINHLVGTVKDVQIDNDGFIKSVSSIEHGELEADLFIDCTGFKSLLLGEALKVDFTSTEEYLFVDTAITMQVPYNDVNAPVASHTISTAQEAGWTWDIGLTERRGIGYVYSSKHTTHERAEEVLRNYVGNSSNGLMARKIPMRTGYRSKQWHKNCVAIGLSAGFLEPLESTAIAMIELAARYLCEEFPHHKSSFPAAEEKFNEVFIYRWKAIVDFVKLHYYLSERTDSQFWIDNADPKTAPDSLLKKLEKWSTSPPTNNDFSNIHDIFGLESHQYILYGMGFKPETESLKFTLLEGKQQADLFLKQVDNLKTKLNKVLPNHRDLLNSISKFEFPTL